MVRSANCLVSLGKLVSFGGDPDVGWLGGLGSSGLNETDRLSEPDIMPNDYAGTDPRRCVLR